MESAKEIKLCSQQDIPADMLREILSRLPVKSLLRFRAVSKSWKSLIDDPDFCGLHLKTFKNNCDETHLFVVQAGHYQERQDHVVRISHTFRTPRSLDYLGNLNESFPTFAKSTDKGWRALCSVDGLVMVEHLTTPAELVLWNPSNRRTHILTPSPAISEGMSNVDLGFGYNPLLNDYQHVRFVHDRKHGQHLAAIYTVKPRSWKTIKFQGKGKGGCKVVWYLANFVSKRKTVCLSGVIYFTMNIRNNGRPDVGAFDLRDKVFASSSLPAIDDHLTKGWWVSGSWKVANILLLDDGSLLGVVCYVPTEGCIWVMEGTANDIFSKCWSKRYTFTFGTHDSRALDGNRIFYRHLKKNGEMILMYKRHVTSYNLETQEEKLLLRTGGDYCRDVWSYKENMFML